MYRLLLLLFICWENLVKGPPFYLQLCNDIKFRPIFYCKKMQHIHFAWLFFNLDSTLWIIYIFLYALPGHEFSRYMPFILMSLGGHIFICIGTSLLYAISLVKMDPLKSVSLSNFAFCLEKRLLLDGEENETRFSSVLFVFKL